MRMTTAFWLAATWTALVPIAAAQTTNTFPASGNVGIGTTTPSAPLQVVGKTWIIGTASIGQNTNGTAVIDAHDGDAFYGNNTATNGIAIDPNGHIGIGTTTPSSTLDVRFAGYGLSVSGDAIGFNREAANGNIFTSTGYAYQVTHTYSTTAGSDFLNWAVWNPSGALVKVSALAVNGLGNVGIGTTAPGAALEVNGSVKLTSGSGGSITFADGTVQGTAYTGVSCGGDYAESMNASSRRKQYEPGDVLVLTSEGNTGDVTTSSEPYSTMVAGIYSTKPGYVGRRQNGAPKSDEIPTAMVGVVPTKVSAENGPIHRGNLLVTAALPGYAMKGTDRARMLGAVVGKAMGSLESGTGEIEVLVTLQ